MLTCLLFVPQHLKCLDLLDGFVNFNLVCQGFSLPCITLHSMHSVGLQGVLLGEITQEKKSRAAVASDRLLACSRAKFLFLTGACLTLCAILPRCKTPSAMFGCAVEPASANAKSSAVPTEKACGSRNHQSLQAPAPVTFNRPKQAPR